MIKLQKDGVIYEATTVDIFPDYTVISWGDYQKLVTKEEWTNYTIITTETTDELYDGDSSTPVIPQ